MSSPSSRKNNLNFLARQFWLSSASTAGAFIPNPFVNCACVCMLLRNKLHLMSFSFNVYFKMAASIDSHFENIKLQYLRTYESDFHAVCIKMFKFPNTFKQNSVLLITPQHQNLCIFTIKKVF